MLGLELDSNINILEDTYENGFDETHRYKCELLAFRRLPILMNAMDRESIRLAPLCWGNLKFYEIIKMAFVLMRFQKSEAERGREMVRRKKQD